MTEPVAVARVMTAVYHGFFVVFAKRLVHHQRLTSLLLQTGKCTQDPVRKEDLANIFSTLSGKDKRPYLLIAAF